jgi:hypothetical protein
MDVDFMEIQNGNGFVQNVGENIKKNMEGTNFSNVSKLYLLLKQKLN